MGTLNWQITSGCESLGGGCESCPSLLEYQNKGWDYSIKTHPERLYDPMKIKEPTNFSVSLGSDLFHKDVPDYFIERAFTLMNITHQHSYNIVTKRAERLREIAPSLEWTENIYIGVTVESSQYKQRIDYLKKVKSHHRFISFVPLLGPVGNLDLSGIEYAGVSSENWGFARPCKDEWIDEIERQCLNQGVGLTMDCNIYQGV